MNTTDTSTYIVTEFELNENTIKTLLSSLEVEIINSHLGIVKTERNKALNVLKAEKSGLITAFDGYPKEDFNNKISL